jgi:hypothetical protein
MAEFKAIGVIQQGIIPSSGGPQPIKPELVSRKPKPLFYAVDSDGVVDESLCYTRHKKLAYGWCVEQHAMATPDTNRVIHALFKKGYRRIMDIMLRRDVLTGNLAPRRMTLRRKRKELLATFSRLAAKPNDLYCRILNVVYEMCNRFKYNHVSQTQIGIMVGKDLGKNIARQTVNLYLRAAEFFGHLVVVQQRHRHEANTYFFPMWAMDIATCYSLAPYLPALADESHLRVTPTIHAYVNNLISLFQEKFSVPKTSYFVQASGMTTSWNENIQKAKGSEPYRAQSEIRERSLSVRQRGIVVKVNEVLMNTDLVAPRPAPNVMTNSPESAKLLVNKGNLEERDPAVDYYREDDEAQPYRRSYQSTPRPEQPRSSVKWVAPQYETLPEAQVNELRYAAIQNPAFQQAYETNLRWLGKEAADMWLEKVLDNVERKEIVPAHTIVVPRTA